MNFEKLIVYLTVAGKRTTSGLELVAFWNPVGELEISNITNISNTPAYKKRRDFEKMLKEKAFATQKPAIDSITQLDATVLGEKT